MRSENTRTATFQSRGDGRAATSRSREHLGRSHLTEVDTRSARTRGSSRIAIHDYCGHPFQFQLSRELARRGHEVRHFFFAEDIGPKGNATRTPRDPITFSVEPISIGRPYSKQNLFRRRQADILYGKQASERISA